jgi:iron complex transport system ATP-binding protein
MDPGARESFLASLRNLGAQKKIPALIYVTHHVEEILPIFGRTLVLRAGKVLHSGKTQVVLRPRVLRELYGVPLTLLKRKGRYWPVID